MEELDKIVDSAGTEFAKAKSLPELDQAKGKFLGKGGALASLKGNLAKVSGEERPALGVRFNALKDDI